VKETMSFLSRIVRFLFWLLIVSWSVALLRRVVAWMLRDAVGNAPQDAVGRNAAQAEGVARRLVRDPVCGTHVAEEVAIPLDYGGELVHFCSPVCRDIYAGHARKLAANG
jgi:YHS domain-containing protein